MVGKKHCNRSKKPCLLHGLVDNSDKLRNLEFKKQLDSSPYCAGRSTSFDSKFWNLSQEKIFNDIYASKHVFKHRFVDWSNIDNGKLCAPDVSKYNNLGLKDLTTIMDESWAWNEELVKQFYATVYIDPDCSRMEFMVVNARCSASKEDIEKALSIKPRASSIILHTPGPLSVADTLSLCVVPDLNTKKVRKCFKPEVDLIVKINEHTLFPRSGNRDGCTEIPLKLAHAIYHQSHFDIAHFLLSEMRAFIKTRNHDLPYAPYIICLMRHLKVIPEDINFPCVPKKYSPQLPKPGAQHGISMGSDAQAQTLVQHEIQVEKDGQEQAVILNVMEQDGQAQTAATVSGMLKGRDTQANATVAQLGISKRQDVQAHFVTQHGVLEAQDSVEEVHSSYNRINQTDHFDSLMTSILQLSEKMDKLTETFEKGFKMMDVRVSHLSSEFGEMKALFLENLGPRAVYKRKRFKKRMDDGSCAAADP